VTVLGLCFGGGQIALGWAGAVLGVLVLSGLKLIEDRMSQARQATLLVVTAAGGPDEQEIRAMLRNDGFRIASCALAMSDDTECTEVKWELHWQSKIGDTKIPDAVYRLRGRDGVLRVGWAPQTR
jgi:putative Mg2+ transporter-C (MgtC) family protein